MLVTKANGLKEPLDIGKINRWVAWAFDNDEALWTSVVTNVEMVLREGIKTTEITEGLVTSCESLAQMAITEGRYEEAEKYMEGGRRLYLPLLYKPVLGLFGVEHPSLKDVIEYGVEQRIYDPLLLQVPEEVYPQTDPLRDNLIPLSGLKQLDKKYFRKHYVNKELIYRETPHILYSLVAISLWEAYKNEPDAAQIIQEVYDEISQGNVNVPTPPMVGLRSSKKAYDSCSLIDVGDSMLSIAEAARTMYLATSARAGMGINVGRIRPEGSYIRGGEVTHTGIIPFLKSFAAITKSCTQNAARGGGGTVNFPIWHTDFFDLVVLKDPMGTEENRINTLDYCVHYSPVFFKLLIEGKKMMLGSPTELNYDLFYRDNTAWEVEYYNWCCQNQDNPKAVDTYDLILKLIQQMMKTGRIYTFNVANVSAGSCYLDPIYMTNLCVEIVEPTTPFEDADPMSGEVAICTLAGIPWGHTKDFKKAARAIAYLQEGLFRIGTNEIPHSAKMKLRRNIGVGAINVQGFLADKNPSSPREAARIVHDTMEEMQLCLLEASLELAKKYGPCEYFDKTKYSIGWLPIDKPTNKYTNFELQQPERWEALRQAIKKHGLRFSSHTAHMPSESSSVVWGFTNGWEFPKGLCSEKTSKKGDVFTVVPNLAKNHANYKFAFGDLDINEWYLHECANGQKFTDQAMSYNTYIDYSLKPKFKDTELIELLFLKPMVAGIKTTYYLNFNVDKEDVVIEQTIKTSSEPIVEEDSSGCGSGGCTL